MDHPTILNAELQFLSPTVLNRESREEIPSIPAGTVVCGKYEIIEHLDVSSGEADLYLCRCGGEAYAAKIYKRQFAIKQEVIDALLTIDSPYVAKLYEAGTHEGYPVEILPYYENGSLQGKRYTLEELTTTVIPNINEGLHALHAAGILHKDLKPSNLMVNKDGTTVSIIDFGISSLADPDSTLLITKTGMTPEYSAPETFKNIFYEGSDYYSFGITLFELFCGYTPYANLQPEEIEQYVSVQRIPFPEEIPPALQDFISALTYYDISYRSNKNNPNRRWTYEEVKLWLQGEPLVIPGEGIGNVGKGALPPYEFMGEHYTELHALVTALAKHWDEGKKQLFRGHITAYFKPFNMEIARKCLAAEEEAGRENGKDDIIFWKLLYQIHPLLKGFYWRGQTYESLPAFGRDVLERLWKGDHSQFSYYSSILSEKLLSCYVQMAAPKNETLKKAAAAIEDSYELEQQDGSDLRRTYFLMAYMLSGQKLFIMDDEQFRTVGELAAYMKRLLEDSLDRFTAACRKLVSYDGQLDFQLETWLIAIGKQAELERWRASINE